MGVIKLFLAETIVSYGSAREGMCVSMYVWLLACLMWYVLADALALAHYRGRARGVIIYTVLYVYSHNKK